MKQAELKDTGRRLMVYARRQWRMLGASLLFFLLGSAVEPVIPALFKKLIDSGFQDGLKFPLWSVPLIIISLFLVRGVFNFSGTYVMTSATSAMVLDLRRDLMRALLRADAKLFTHVSPGVAVTKVINDPQSASQVIGNSLITFVKDATTLMFLVGYLLYLNWQLTLLSFISMPLLGITIKLVQKRLSKVGQEQYLSQQRLVSTVDDNARAWRVVRTFDAADFELKRFDAEASQYRRMTLKQVATSALVTPATQVVAAIGVSTIITLALWQASQGSATVGEFVSFVTALLMTISPMRHLTDVYQPINSALITARGSFSLMDAPQEPDHGTQDLPVCQGRIDFRQVKVQYEEAATPSLDGLDLQIAPGTTVALVGSSGAGKTTVVNTLLRFAHVNSGEVLLDGQPIESLQLASLRRHFAVVSQDIVLFDGSIAQNVAYASPLGVDRAKVEQCLRAANLWNHVAKLPEGIDAPVGTNGSMLSGGQRQRLAIARALYRDAAIWIFDEATSALDSESEAVVQRSIEDLRHAKTLILIAHRLSTIRNADLICVMSDGRIIEQGSHEELMAKNGSYAGMVRIQSANL
ncbi:lipid A export permease/ATP-binding protein MsbA [Malikia spinosa]|jgi:subfamily B ATP-binding cassette protein MsbA|uniref:Lipid A export permease/ATP-binding protein MsbA n=1 Tax=Malikia spinosa TaxID=86180 RepID=A0A2S9KFZ8_9BURK|nr:lipid A export permease/ATP-binding protein MsbA [Malikia spinosa]OGB68296.1 MAG: lipid A export permease/ATP-binding protein MsbA [Burkholderiales bacterium RIFOXYC12_FULL_65_23]PRD69362.1 lipid A export permease/ATP-binding protein MsbA [Malikia spinosa]